MDDFLLEYIAQRMNEMGFNKYHFEPVRFSINAAQGQIQAYNEFYYLVNKTVPPSLVIASDTNIFNESANYSDYAFYQVQEFTGLIEISQAAAPIDLQFIKVLPDCNN